MFIKEYQKNEYAVYRGGRKQLFEFKKKYLHIVQKETNHNINLIFDY